jgi:hypothetical protein
LILNEDRMAIYHKIVPNDRRNLIQQLLKEIWSVSGATKICEVVYINNSKVNSALF